MRRTDAVELLAQVEDAGGPALADLRDDRPNRVEGVLDVDLRPRDDAPQSPGTQGLASKVESAHHRTQV